MNLKKALLCACSLVVCSPVLAWHEAGHRAVGAIAFSQLNSLAKTTLTQLLQYLPDPKTPNNSVTPPDPFGQLTFDYHPTSKSVITPATLETAADWPDLVRGTSLDRPDWHYINLPINGPGGKAPTVVNGRAVDALQALVGVARDLSEDLPTRAMAIAWIAHIVGDLHQPLHATNYFDTQHPTGDKGGNEYLLGTDGKPVRDPNLHSYWDGVVGESASDVPALLARIAALPAPDPKLVAVNIGAMRAAGMAWANESLELAKNSVYRLDAAGKPQLSPDASQFDPAKSEPGAQAIGDQRVQLAGYRLAAILNAALG
jgi:hypothetical protein